VKFDTHALLDSRESDENQVFLDETNVGTSVLGEAMPETNQQAPPDAVTIGAAAIERNLRRLDRRQWWMWSTAFFVITLLTVAVASFVFPSLSRIGTGDSLAQAVRCLLGLVLIFNLYTIHQQLIINRIRTQMANQIQSLAKVESLATEVYKLAALDQLTGLYNRRSAEQRLEEEMSRAIRHARPLTLLLVDLNGLKKVNDTLGHGGGDSILCNFAERLRRAIRGSDLAARIGGDEFMVILPECRPEEVQHVLGRLEGLNVEYDGSQVPVSFAAGWRDYLIGETAQEFIKRVDEALYADKRGARV
jgi:diguanylate cyclase (GGDEF)-like protein